MAHGHARRVVFIVWQVAFVVFGLVHAGVKVGSDGFLNYRLHFTNWSMGASTIFFWVALAGYASSWLDSAWHLVALPVVWASACTVFLGSLPLLYLNSGMLSDSNLSLGTTILFEKALHVFPLMWLVIYVASRLGELRAIFRRAGGSALGHSQRAAAAEAAGRPLPASDLSWPWLAWLLLMTPRVMPAVYLATTDVTSAYDVVGRVSPLLVTLGMLTVAFLSGAVLVVVMYDRRRFALSAAGRLRH